MIGITRTPPLTTAGYFKHFISQFPSPDARREYALGLLPGGDLSPSEVPYPTRAVLAAHWAEDTPALVEKAKALYDLSYTTQKLAGQTVLRITGVGLDELLNDETSIPTHGLSVDTARIDDEGSLKYEFSDPSDLDIDPSIPIDVPCLGYRISSLVSVPGQAVEIHQGPSAEVHEMYSNALPVYAGTVCLENDYQLYHTALRQRTTEGLVFGNRNSFAVLSKVVSLLGGQAEEEFIKRIESEEVSPVQPLPDLGFLTA